MFSADILAEGVSGLVPKPFGIAREKQKVELSFTIAAIKQYTHQAIPTQYFKLRLQYRVENTDRVYRPPTGDYQEAIQSFTTTKTTQGHTSLNIQTT